MRFSSTFFFSLFFSSLVKKRIRSVLEFILENFDFQREANQ